MPSNILSDSDCEAPSATDSHLMERLASLDNEDARLLRTHSDPEEVRQSLSMVRFTTHGLSLANERDILHWG